MTHRDLPKIELHLHLEGAAPPAFIRQMAAEKKIDLSGIFAPDGSYVFQDFNHFLRVYEAACEPLTTPEDFHRLTRAVCAELAAHNVVYAETFVSPDFCGGGRLDDWRDYLAAMTEAAAEAERVDGVTLKGIVTCIRHFGPEPARKAAICAAETKGDFVRGFGMAGGELSGRPADFAWSFDCAREAGLPLTAHAGEWGEPDMVAETVDALKVSRVGHGINAIRDPDLVKRLAEEGIVLEVCPGSNVVLNAVSDWRSHPIAKLRDAGVPVTVSTDDPPFFHTTMTAEYDALASHFGWTEEDFAAVNRTALDAAFCDDATRARIAKRLETTP